MNGDNKFVEGISRVSGKIGSNKFILAIRDAFAEYYSYHDHSSSIFAN